jgi:haloacetate dehalogenase
VMRDFESALVDTGRTTVFLRKGGHGPALLLLHGFPETHLMWRRVAPLLATRFTVVCADLPGYGRSGCPPPQDRHSAHSKRAMAADLVAVMASLGFNRFNVAGHDRGGRVAYRIALDFPDQTARLAVLDIIPTFDAWQRADLRLALGYWPWSLLAQPAPLPERLVGAAPDAIVDAALSGWGSPEESFEREVRAEYIEALRDADHVHAICEEYRAAATIDREHDEADLNSGRRIACPTLALWSLRGPLGTWYEDAGGPDGIWREWCISVRGEPMRGGHFFPEEHPADTASALEQFFA